MGSSQFSNFLLLVSLLSICNRAVSGDDPPPATGGGFHGAERDALLALKASFNNSFLNHNWTGIMCYMNDPPKWHGIQCSGGRVTKIALKSLWLMGKIKPDALFNLTELSMLSLRNNSISGNMMDFSYNRRMQKIDLSGNDFDGSISPSLLNLDFLESLQLQDNKLTGSILGFNQSSLIEFNVSNNYFSGEIPNTQALKSFNFASYFGNYDLCGSPSPTPCSNNESSDSNGDKSKSKDSTISRFAAILIVVDIVGIIVIVLLFVIYIKKSRKLKEAMRRLNARGGGVQSDEQRDVIKMEARENKEEEIEEKRELTFIEKEASFTLKDLLKASAEGLGKGSFGNCYKAMLEFGQAIVVKRLRDLKPLSSEEFVKQLKAIGDQKHPNLMPLLAYYYSMDEKLLVYRYAPNGNVYNRIHGARGTKDRVPFRWSSRLSVARGVARALEYLHMNSKTLSIVPHGNLKSTNILLDENETVFVSDYGLASLIAIPIATQRMVSYKSPEYQSHKRVSKKSDVWSYGCLLLELLTGRVPAHSAPDGVKGVELCSWVHRAVREEWTAEIFDVEIAAQRSTATGMLRLLQIAIRCCDNSPEKRPEITEVVREVENIKAVVESEDEDESSYERSLTDESMSVTPSVAIGYRRRYE